MKRVLHTVYACCLLAALAGGVAGCSGLPVAPGGTPPTFTLTDLVVGSGATAATGQVATVNYTGWLFDADRAEFKGPPFDSSLGRAPFSFTLGGGQVIKGWDDGVVGMNVGGLRRLVIPPSLGYGDTRRTAIPPNSTLVFDIELLALE